MQQAKHGNVLDFQIIVTLQKLYGVALIVLSWELYNKTAGLLFKRIEIEQIGPNVAKLISVSYDVYFQKLTLILSYVNTIPSKVISRINCLVGGKIAT